MEIVGLTNEQGQSHTFVVLDRLSLNGKNYAALAFLEPPEGAEADVLLFTVTEDDEFGPLDDEEEFNMVVRVLQAKAAESDE